MKPLQQRPLIVTSIPCGPAKMHRKHHRAAHKADKNAGACQICSPEWNVEQKANLMIKVQVMPNPQQPQPTQQDRTLLFLPHRQCRYHICSDNRHRFPSADLDAPSSRLLPFVLSCPSYPLQNKGFLGVVARGHLRDNAEWWCVDSQNLGSNGHPGDQGECQQRASESVHLPTKVN